MNWWGIIFISSCIPRMSARAKAVPGCGGANGTSSFRFEHRTIHKDQIHRLGKDIFTVIRRASEDEPRPSLSELSRISPSRSGSRVEMAELNSRLQSSMELERLRLAQELHDSPMQSLYSAIYRIEELRSTANPELKEALQDVKQHIQNVLQDLRATAKELRPPYDFQFWS